MSVARKDDLGSAARAVPRVVRAPVAPAPSVLATPIDKVYEHGFYPLQGGFKIQPGDQSFEVFDQWVEIVPTDQSYGGSQFHRRR